MPIPSRPKGRHGDGLSSAVEITIDTPFKFPRMDFLEIQEDMSQTNVLATKEMMRAPSPNDVRRIFDHFIEDIGGKKQEDMAQPAFGCLEKLEYHELYETAIPHLHYLREIQKIFKAAKFDEISLRDIHAPEKSRFHWQLCALLNFVKFRYTRLEVFERMAKNAEDLVEKERVLLEQKTQLEDEIKQIQNARAAEETERQKVRKELSSSLVEMDALHKQQQEIVEDTREMKADLELSIEKAAKIKMRKMTLRQQVEAMRCRIVGSPTRVMTELAEMSTTIETEKENIGSVEKRTRTLRMRTDALKEATNKVIKVNNEMSGCIEQQIRLKELKSDIEEYNNKKNQHETEVKSIAHSKAHLQRLIDSIETKLIRIHEQQNEIDTMNSESNNRLNERMKKFAQEKERINSLVDQKVAEVEQIQKDIENCVNSFSTEVGKVIQKQDLLNHKLMKNESDMMNTMLLVTEANNSAFEESRNLLARDE